MNDSNKDDAPVSIGFNERQSAYLQRLGLKALLERSFPKSVTGLLKQFWQNRMTVLVFGLGVYAVSASFTVASLNEELKEFRYSVEDMRSTGRESFKVSKKAANPRQANPNKRLPFYSDKEMLAVVLEKTGTINAINEPMTGAGGTILHASMMKHVSTQYLDFLIENGADLNARRTGGGETPLMVALNRNALEQAHHLLVTYPEKIDLTIVNSNGKTLYQAILRKERRSGGERPLLTEIVHLTYLE